MGEMDFGRGVMVGGGLDVRVRMRQIGMGTREMTIVMMGMM